MRPTPLAALAAFFIVVSLMLTAPRSAEAKASREQLLQLLAQKPATMSTDAWRAQRREAARELGRLRERRATPTLLSIVARERFDVILEIAIDALGNIGDKRAAEPLKKLLDDPSLDAYVRDAVANALKKIGSSDGGTTRKPRRPRKPTKPAKSDGTREAKNPYLYAALPKLKLDAIPDDLIAESSNLELATSTGSFSWNSGSDRTSAGLAANARYRLQVERQKIGYSVDGSALLGFGLEDPPGADNTSWLFNHALQINPELRYYPFQKDLPQLFGQLLVGVGYGLTLASPPAAQDNRVDFASTLSLAGAIGYGRILDVGSQLRLRRIERVLNAAGLLEGEAIDGPTGRKLARLWYQLRNTVGNYAQLGYTLRILRDAGLLKKDVDPATSYRLVRLLDDPQLFGRRSGLMTSLGYGYARTLVKDADDDNLAFLFGRAEYHRQTGTTREYGAEASFFWSHLGSPDTYNVALAAYYNWFLYNRAFDPLGAIGATASAGLSNQPGSGFSDGGLGYEVLLGASYTRLFNRGTRIQATLSGGGGRRGAVILFSIEARYGVASGAMVLQ